jgi:hypothetical protein
MMNLLLIIMSLRKNDSTTRDDSAGAARKLAPFVLLNKREAMWHKKFTVDPCRGRGRKKINGIGTLI